jgi:hypothetical protein
MPASLLDPEMASVSVDALAGTLAQFDGDSGCGMAMPMTTAEGQVLGRCTQATLQLLLHQFSSDSAIPQLSSQLTTLAPLLVMVAQQASPATRHLALEVLLALSVCPYPQLHPVRQVVIRGLARVCDDRKRAVRMLAAKVRNVFYSLK